ncbi:hypothetical protein [Nocardioides sp. B-3]|uniref:hypothetical protein n=1 Tax=Nocardioides sp. B-3 TaxID=2895565 RepID=UPI0021537599|nr:hypothetical protein [Nocardioides sp. B-3]UUZ59043.1 hypothetical protein LP418_24205 [Nocardioides sp. B-3]
MIGHSNTEIRRIVMLVDGQASAYGAQNRGAALARREIDPDAVAHNVGLPGGPLCSR